MNDRDDVAGGDTKWQDVGEGGAYGIPYRSLLPRRVEGMLVVERCFSAADDVNPGVAR